MQGTATATRLRHRMALAVLGGIAAELAAPPINAWPLGIVAMALLIAALRGATVRQACPVGATWGSVYYLLHLRWAFVATNALPWLALALLQTFFVVVLSVVIVIAMRSRLAQQRPWLALAVYAGAAWAMMDLVRGRVPFGGFPWGSLAVSQVDSPLKSLAWLGGTSFLTFVMVIISVVGLKAFLDLRERSVVPAAVRVGCVLIVMVLTAIIPLNNNAESGTLRVGAVQGNVPDPGQAPDGGVAWQVLLNHVDATRDLMAKPEAAGLDLILWPEDGAMTDLSRWEAAVDELQGIVDEAGVPILVGTQEYPDSGGRYNLVAVWAPDQGEVARYTKQHPVPFGEYIPMRGFFRIFSDQVDRVTTDMMAGHGPAILDVEIESLAREVGIGAAICFEIAYRDIVRESVRLGAEVLFVPTNNASFGRTPESWQQLGLTRLAAIEYGRSAIQVSTVGVSAIVHADGSIQQQTGHFTAESMVADVPLRTGMTPAMTVGHGVNMTFGALVLVGLALGLTPDRRGKQIAERNVTTRDD